MELIKPRRTGTLKILIALLGQTNWQTLDALHVLSLQMLTYNEKYTPNPELDQLFKDMAAAEAETKEE